MYLVDLGMALAVRRGPVLVHRQGNLLPLQCGLLLSAWFAVASAEPVPTRTLLPVRLVSMLELQCGLRVRYGSGDGPASGAVSCWNLQRQRVTRLQRLPRQLPVLLPAGVQ